MEKKEGVEFRKNGDYVTSIDPIVELVELKDRVEVTNPYGTYVVLKKDYDEMKYYPLISNMKKKEIRIAQAKSFAVRKHNKQLDDEGVPYFLAHLEPVAQILSCVTDDEEIIMAGYLHDTIEDTATTYEELVDNFGERVADLVMEVTHEGKKDEVGFYFPRLKTREGIMIKFADRLNNLSRMENWGEDRKEQYLRKSKFWKS